MKKRIIKISEFEPAIPRYTREAWTTDIIDITKYQIDKTYNNSQNFAKMIDDTVKLLEIRTNNSLLKNNIYTNNNHRYIIGCCNNNCWNLTLPPTW